ncbi:MAG: murein transglycosylase domain-containing protein [Sulfurimonas sp.]
MQIQKTLSNSLCAVALLMGAADIKADSFTDYKQTQQQNFQANTQKFIYYKNSLNQDFLNYKKAQQKAYNEYKEELKKYWDKPEISTKKRLVHYTQDKQTKTAIDFEKQKIEIQTIAKNKKEAKQKLAHALLKATLIDTKQLYKEDELLQKIAHIKTPSSIVKANVDAKPILAPAIFDKKPSANELINYTKKTLEKNPIQERVNSKQKHVYTLNVTLPSDTTIKRSRTYYQEVQTAAKKEKLTPALIFAIMHTESSFNPYARSYVPAYGLMQIVPRTAGVDAYYYLYREKKLVSGSYLYNSRNNIQMGSAYLHILYYSYLRYIKDPQSRLYCTIAAYNTGAGNVARAFVSSNSIKYAAQKINTMSSDDVYAHLRRNLRYKEARDYLLKVEKRRRMYKKIYGS